MVRGWRDFTAPVTIEAVTVETLPVDIKAQTIAALKIDVAAQSLDQLNVNLAACAVTLNVNIAASAVTLNVKTAVGEHVDADIVSSITLKTDIAAQSVGYIGVDIKAQTLSRLNVNIAASAITLDVNIASSAATLNVNLVSSAVTLDVNIAASAVTLNVNIVSSATTLNVNIASQTVDVNIKTSGGANIIIDKLTQAAYTARVDTLAWNGASPSWTAITGNYRYGKLFPRGARGFLRYIDIYCMDAGTAGGTVYVFISPAPYLGPVYSGTVTVPAGSSGSWRTLMVNKMWNYDSLFIWTYTSSSDIQLAYDSGGPDCFYSVDGGLNWAGHPSYRFWFRVGVQGLTVGDIPVSGTLNTIEVPHIATGAYSIQTPAAGTFVECFTVRGPGENVATTIRCNKAYGMVRITCDGNVLSFFGDEYLYLANVTSMNGGGFGSQSTAEYGWVSISLPFRWRQSCRVEVGTPSGQTPAEFKVSMLYGKIT